MYTRIKFGYAQSELHPRLPAATDPLRYACAPTSRTTCATAACIRLVADLLNLHHRIPAQMQPKIHAPDPTEKLVLFGETCPLPRILIGGGPSAVDT